MQKQIILLGLLLQQPMYGQQLRNLIETHHPLFADVIKKPTMYYQLERLVQDGHLEIRQEIVEAPGPGRAHEEFARRPREVYYLTETGKQYFYQLLCTAGTAYAPTLSEADICLFFLHYLTEEEATNVLNERYDHTTSYRKWANTSLAKQNVSDDAHRMVYDHLLTLLDGELAWIADISTWLGAKTGEKR